MLVQEEPFPGESLTSLISRQASANGFPRAHDYLLALIRNGDVGLEWISAFEQNKAELWAGRKNDAAPGRKGEAKRFLQSHPRHFCPACLEEGAYWRTSWEYTFFAFCPVHRVWMEDRCASCGSTVGLWDGASHCPSCGNLLRFHQQQELIADEKALTLAQILARSAEHGSWTPDLVDMETPWRLPSPLTYEQLSRLVLLLGSYAQGRDGKPRKIPFKSDALTVRAIVTRAAHALFPWPQAFHSLLASLRRSGQPTMTGKMSYFYKAIFTEFQRTEVDFLLVELEAYLKENWEGVLSHRLSNLSAELLAGQRLQSAAKLAKSRGLPKRELIRGIETGDIPGLVEPLPSGRRRVSLRVDLLDQVVEKLDLLTLGEASAALGLAERRLRELLQAGVLHGRPPVGGGSWAIPRAQVVALGARLLALGMEVPARKSKSLSYLARYFPAVSDDFPRFMEDVLAGKIPVRLIGDVNPPPFERIVISVSDLRRWELQRTGKLSVPRAAELLGLKQEVAYHLFRRGILKTVIDESTGPVMTDSHIQSFQQRYVLASELALRVGVSPRAVIAELRVGGIDPASGPGVDGGRQTIFERLPAELALCGRESVRGQKPMLGLNQGMR